MVEIVLPVPYRVKLRDRKGRTKKEEWKDVASYHRFQIEEVPIEECDLVAQWDRKSPNHDVIRKSKADLRNGQWQKQLENNVDLACMVQYGTEKFTTIRGGG
jgi:hypothetical protein